MRTTTLPLDTTQRDDAPLTPSAASHAAPVPAAPVPAVSDTAHVGSMLRTASLTPTTRGAACPPRMRLCALVESVLARPITHSFSASDFTTEPEVANAR